MVVYIPRILDDLLAGQLKSIGAVLIEGPKHCGKTTTASRIAGSITDLSNENQREQNLTMAAIDPGRLLKGKIPRQIDEWQLAAQLWDAVRSEVDERAAVGQFVLTGSSMFDDSKVFHSGAGRIARLRMRTMSLAESGESNGTVSLKELFAGHDDIGSASELTLEDIAFLICRGGWPKGLGLSQSQSLKLVHDYLEDVVTTELKDLDGVQRRGKRVRQFLGVYARHQSLHTPIVALRDEMRCSDSDRFSERTLQSYIKALKQIFVIEDMPAWHPNLRCKAAIRTSDTHYFCDPSFAAAALRLGPDKMIDDLKIMNSLFKTLCIRDLRVYADALDGDVYHYRDKSGLECDAVLSLHNGHYGLIQIKLGGQPEIEHGVRTLIGLENKIDTQKMPVPSFLMVLTAVGDYAYRRKDGIRAT